MASLRTDYKDDILTGSRKYRMTVNPDGTVSFTDETEYTQVGDTWGASELNAQNEIINQKGCVTSQTPIDPSQRIDGNLYFFYST